MYVSETSYADVGVQIFFFISREKHTSNMLLFEFYSTLVATWWIDADIETREGNSDSEMWFKETVNRIML